MPTKIGATSPDGVDYGWVLQVTFITTIILGVPIVAVAAMPFELTTWGQRANFAIRMGAVVWLGTSIVVYWYARTNLDT